MNITPTPQKPQRAAQIQQAIGLMEAQKLDDAEIIIREVLTQNEKDCLPWNVLGIILKRKGLFSDAIEAFLKASKYDAKNDSPISNLGNTYLESTQYDKAAECFNRCIRLKPKNGEYYRMLALTLKSKGEIKKAIASLKSAAVLAPKDVRIYIDFASNYLAQHAYTDALGAIEKALNLTPDNIQLYMHKALVFTKMAKFDEAKEFLATVIHQFPNAIEPYIFLGNMHHYDLGDFEAANGYFAQGYAIAPNNIHLLCRYAECLLNSRYGSEAAHIQHAYELAKQILELGPVPLENADAIQKVLLRTVDFEALEQLPPQNLMLQYWLKNKNVGAMHNQLGRVKTQEDRHTLVKLHKEWGRQTEAGIIPFPMPTQIHRNEKIRIGLMSSDLRDHPVTYFALPIIQFFNKQNFEVYCYSFYPKAADKVQEYITEKSTCFRLMAGASDKQVAQKIHDDQIDILFELGGATFLNKVAVCAHRAAPIQVSWLGYPHSMGLSAIDYILTDKYITPKDLSLLIEKPFELPNSWVTLGNIGFPPVPIDPKIPEERNGYITFGTMNNPYKYTKEAIMTWAKIMTQVPNSRFIFVRPESGVEAFKHNVIKAFALEGIDQSRIEFIAKRGAHLPFYNAIDIALDTFPHTGGTTTCETLWMGVPCVTLIGPAFFERLSYSNLSNSGLEDLCATSVEEYIKIAVELAANMPRRQFLRHNLRPQIRNHPLGLQEQWVRDFEAKIIDIINGHKRG